MAFYSRLQFEILRYKHATKNAPYKSIFDFTFSPTVNCGLPFWLFGSITSSRYHSWCRVSLNMVTGLQSKCSEFLSQIDCKHILLKLKKQTNHPLNILNFLLHLPVISLFLFIYNWPIIMKLHDCSFNWKVTEESSFAPLFLKGWYSFVVEDLQQVAYRASSGHGPSGRTPEVEGDLSLPKDRKLYNE